MTDKIRQAAEECARECGIYGITERIGELAEHIERAMRKLLPSEPNPYAIARDIYLPIIRAYAADRVNEAVEAEREACAKIADEDFTLDEHTPCDEGHREFYKKYGTAEVCEAIRARGSSNALKEYVAERVKEAEQREREWFRDNGCWSVAMKRIAELEAQR